MALEVSVTRGPLAAEGLADIAATYGSVDARYASPDFCRILFNENPVGYSYHAFVRDGGRAVGHYAMIPMWVRARGATVISCKGEALFLDPKHRSTSVATPAGPALPGIAMMRTVHERALADGVAVLHSITTPPVGIILRMHGFRALKVPLDQFEFFISGSGAARLVGLGQRGLLAAAGAAQALTAAPDVEVRANPDAGRHLSALAATDAEGRGWGISRDLETLAWMQRIGRLQLYETAGRAEHFALVAGGKNVREILLWSVPPRERRAGLALVSRIVAEGIRDGARTASVSRRVLAQAGSSLAFAVRALGFLPRKSSISLYAKSADDFFLQGANVDFSRLFNL